MPSAATLAPPESLWLELTGRCQLACGHCYADSSPAGSHGAMTVEDWLTVLDGAAELGVGLVQFIGGEPTLHPAFEQLVRHALARGLAVEVYSNLLHVPARLWEVFALPGVRLATSYYSADVGEHETVTGRRGSHARTRANIAKAARQRIPLRVGLIDTGAGAVDAALTDLEALGITDVGVDAVRGFGRAAGIEVDLAGTCGDCGHGTAAIGPDGQVWPCVFTRQISAGDVRETPLGEILAGEAFTRQVTVLDQIRRPGPVACSPPDIKCSPRSACAPSCTPSCTPNKGSDCQPKPKGK